MKQITEFVAFLASIFFSSAGTEENENYLVDNVIEKWAPKYGLQPIFFDRDEKVKSMSIVDDNGNSYQIWLELIGSKYIIVLASNNKRKEQNKNWKVKGTLKTLEQNLDIAYLKVSDWITETGNTRTYVKN